MKILIPTEEQEQITFVQYLDIKRINYWHTPNSTYTKSWNIKRRNSRLGVKSGIPDLFVIINNKLYGIEMKRKKNSVVSVTQKKWIKVLNDAGIETIVANGAEEAIEFVQKKLLLI